MPIFPTTLSSLCKGLCGRKSQEIQQNNKVACKTKSFHESVNLFALIMMLQVTTLYGTKIGKIHPR